MIENRRDSSTTFRKSPDISAPPPISRNQIGITIWLDTIVESAIAATITIEVAEENPPRNDITASPVFPDVNGIDRT